MKRKTEKSLNEQQRIVAYLDSVQARLAAKGAYPQADTSKEESAIDEMVALRQLYGLAEDEIMIVEGS